jgi:hypothetical protein
MIERGNALSRNPNICASCSSLADGMEESSIARSYPSPTPEAPVRENRSGGVEAEVVMEEVARASLP